MTWRKLLFSKKNMEKLDGRYIVFDIFVLYRFTRYITHPEEMKVTDTIYQDTICNIKKIKSVLSWGNQTQAVLDLGGVPAPLSISMSIGSLPKIFGVGLVQH